MTDHDALLSAIIANRDEDTPRLVYADWCSENGQEEYGEFIRVQCELSGMREECSVFEADWFILLPGPKGWKWKGQPCTREQYDRLRRCSYLRRKEYELLGPHGPQWTNGDWYGHNASEWFVESMPNGVLGRHNIEKPVRGFVSHLNLWWQEWVQHHEIFCKSMPIERIKLRNWPEYETRSVGRKHTEANIAGKWILEPNANEGVTEKVLSLRWTDIKFDLPAQRYDYPVNTAATVHVESNTLNTAARFWFPPPIRR